MPPVVEVAMVKLKVELVCCLRESLALLWEGPSLPRRPVSPPLDWRRVAGFFGTHSGFSTPPAPPLWHSRKSAGDCSHNQQAPQPGRMCSPASHLGTQANSNISKTPLPAKSSGLEQPGASTAVLPLRLFHALSVSGGGVRMTGCQGSPLR